MKNTTSRDEFVKTTIMNTLGHYLKTFCAPCPVEEAHKRCLEDAEKLADRVYGTIEVNADNVVSIIPVKSPEANPQYNGSGGIRPYRPTKDTLGYDAHPSMTRRLRNKPSWQR
jgi:hypothetical protein